VPEGIPGLLWTVGPTLVATIVLALAANPGTTGFGIDWIFAVKGALQREHTSLHCRASM